MADKLSLFNGALRILGERSLVSLTEDREPRRVLESAWFGNEAIKFCLEQGLWNFAMRSLELPFSPSITPGVISSYRYGFEKPEDFIRTAAFCSDPRWKCPILDYLDNNKIWYADEDTVYVRYVSMDTDTGLDLSIWPASFSKYVEAYLAVECAPRITENESRRDAAERTAKQRLLIARSRDAMEDPTKDVSSAGAFVSARAGWGGQRRMFRDLR